MNYILLSAFIGECTGCKNMHGLENVKFDIRNLIFMPSFGAEILTRMGR
jgi:hypothetical protein